jgi:hypothetical protein
VLGQARAEQAQRLGRGRLHRLDVQPAGLLAGRLEQERLALAAPPADHPERGARCIVGAEPDQRVPLDLPVEHVLRPPHLTPHSSRARTQVS